MKKLSKPILAEGKVTGHVHELEKDTIVYEKKTELKNLN